MIEHLPSKEQEWLARFFAMPNELSWLSLLDGSAPPIVAVRVRQWLDLLARSRTGDPLILPFVRNGTITGWYATTQCRSGGYELGDEINAWLGPTWLSRSERVSDNSSDPMATVLRDRFGGTVYRFTGPDHAAKQVISERLSEFAEVIKRRPLATQTRIRPVGAIRTDFERALLAGDQVLAEAKIAEFKQTGRLNEENLRYLEIRMSAGLGLWPEIARDHWRIKTLADLALPPQIQADLIEALYRTYVEEAEIAGGEASMREAFANHIATPYPKLFASRRGIRVARVVKAFLLFEIAQARPDAAIVHNLIALLPAGTDVAAFVKTSASVPEPTSACPTLNDEADEAFDNFQLDRAFEFYLRLPPTLKTISRLVLCVETMGTSEARDRLLKLVDVVDADLIGGLASGLAGKLAALRGALPTESTVSERGDTERIANPWMAWAEQLQAGRDLTAATREVQSAPTNWDASALREDGLTAQRFAYILGRLDGEASTVLRIAVPQIFASIFPPNGPVFPASKPIASLLFLLITMDESLSRADLEIIAQLMILLIEQGLSSSDYVSLIGDLEDVQKRIGSYAYLAWSLDVSETLAVLPCPSDAARDARLRLFLLVLGQASGFAHRLVPLDLVPIETLAKDYGVSPEAVGALKREADADEQEAVLPSLYGKTIGIYTLAETAGNRAKAALEKIYPGCSVVLNSDLVCTLQLSAIAKAADIFVFAWRSSSHQAFYCIKNALSQGEPIWAQGKGTASILRAIRDHLA